MIMARVDRLIHHMVDLMLDTPLIMVHTVHLISIARDDAPNAPIVHSENMESNKPMDAVPAA